MAGEEDGDAALGVDVNMPQALEAPALTGTWEQYLSGSFMGVELLMSHAFDDETERQYKLHELSGLFMDEAADLVRALYHFFEMRFFKGTIAPNQILTF